MCVGFPSDVWSVGLVALEGILGSYPYPSFTSHFDLVNSVVNGPPPTASPTVKQRLSPDFWALLDSLVAKEPISRPDCYMVARSPFMLRTMSQPCDLASWFRRVAACSDSGDAAVPGAGETARTAPGRFGPVSSEI